MSDRLTQRTLIPRIRRSTPPTAAAGGPVSAARLGEAASRVRRSGARAGDVIPVAGQLGRSAAGVAVLELAHAPGVIDATALTEVTSAHVRPLPRVAEGQCLAAA